MKREELVERAKAAIAQVQIKLPGAGGLRGELTIAPAHLTEMAEAALTAILEGLREPTQAMADAGDRLIPAQPGDSTSYARAAWSAMLFTLDGPSTGMGGEG